MAATITRLELQVLQEYAQVAKQLEEVSPVPVHYWQCNTWRLDASPEPAVDAHACSTVTH